MLSAEAKERARKRWLDMFDNIYPNCESMFWSNATLVISNTEDFRTYGEDGREYTLQVAPWESEDE